MPKGSNGTSSSISGGAGRPVGKRKRDSFSSAKSDDLPGSASNPVARRRTASQPTVERGVKEKVGIFISYPHEDAAIANTLRQCLIAISVDLSVFIDHASLVSGDDYENVLARNIAGSQWFLMICSGPPREERNMGWCFQESGQFRAKLQAEGKKKDFIQDRLVTIHDDMRPRPVAKYQSVSISTHSRSGLRLDLSYGNSDLSPFEDTDAFKLLSEIITLSRGRPLRSMAESTDRELVREQARRLIRTFAENGGDPALPEIVLQPRISFFLARDASASNVALGDDIVITGYEASLRDVFGILGTTTTWGAIKHKLTEPDGNDPLWVQEIEQAAVQATKGIAPEQPVGLCMAASDRTSVVFYRVLFARYIPYRSNAKTCYVTFIPSRPRQFELRKRSSILLSALILSVRFRQKIIPFRERLTENTRATRIEQLVALERTLHQVETEAIEFGLDLGAGEEIPILQYVRAGKSYEFMEKSMVEWTESRKIIGETILAIRKAKSDQNRAEAAAIAEAAVIEQLGKVAKNNGRFIKILSDELSFSEGVENANAE